MHLLPQHLVQLRDPDLVAAGVAPVRAVVLLLQHHPLLSLGALALTAAGTALKSVAHQVGADADICRLPVAAGLLEKA